MSDPPVRDFQVLLELARASAEALCAAGVAPRAGPAPGWLVMQRLDRQEVFHDAEADDARRETLIYEQIWLTPGGELCTAWRVTADNTAGADATRPGTVVRSVDDLGAARWGGDHDEHPTMRIAAALKTLTGQLIKVQSLGPRVPAEYRFARSVPPEFVALAMVVLVVAVAVVAAEFLWTGFWDMWG